MSVSDIKARLRATLAITSNTKLIDFSAQLHERSERLQTSVGDLVPDELVDRLMFCSYSANRGYGMTPEALGRLFKNVDITAYEARYQRELRESQCQQ